MKKILELLYPACCPICDQILRPAEKSNHCCASCIQKLPWIAGAVCEKCGKPVLPEQEYCRDCRNQKHIFTRGAAAFTYSGGLPDAVYRMKYQNRRDYRYFFAQAMAKCCGSRIRKWNPQVILPVPIHWRKRGRRGFNQSELLAEELGKMLNIPVRKDLLRCRRMTAAQKTLGRKERQQNLRGSFVPNGPIQGLRRVLIVDDIYTTGSTMDEIARVLKKAGVDEVYFAVLCTGQGDADAKSRK